MLMFPLAAITSAVAGYTQSATGGDKERDLPFFGEPERAAGSLFDKSAAGRLREALPWFPRTDAAADPPAEARLYRDHYRMGSGAKSWHIGRIAFRAGHIAVQSFTPDDPAPSGTVLFIHGYLDHIGLNRYPVDALLERGYRVVGVDLPGHGLSNGERGWIDDFGQYGAAVSSVVRTIRAGGVPDIPSDTRLAALGHSTGGSALIEHLAGTGERRNTDRIERVVLVAPLVRLYAFPLARFGVRLASNLVDSLPRRISGSSSNDEYIRFAREYDPLGIYEAPLDWANAYLEWEESRREWDRNSFNGSRTPLLLIQSGRDTVVDTAYNTEFLTTLFRRSEVSEYPDARHSIFTEPEEKRYGLYDRINRFLSGSESLAD